MGNIVYNMSKFENNNDDGDDEKYTKRLTTKTIERLSSYQLPATSYHHHEIGFNEKRLNFDDYSSERNKTKGNHNVKLLLCANRHSGKTTIFKQIKHLYDIEPYSHEALAEFKASVYASIMEGVKIIYMFKAKYEKDKWDDEKNEVRSYWFLHDSGIL
jgi:hypothetical protein